MSKGSWRRRSGLSDAEERQRYIDAGLTGPKLNVMSDADRVALGLPPEKMQWHGPGYRQEYTCAHGVGHGPHTHGCDGCCAREDYPYSPKTEKGRANLARYKDTLPKGRKEH